MKPKVITGILVIIQLVWVGLANAQTQPVIMGRVMDASTNPLPFATVYINASTRGTTADADGQYRLTGVPAGTVELVASSVGYKTGRQTIRLGDQNRSVNFTLTPDAKALQTVTVTAKRTKAYDRMVRTFKRELLGNTPFADKCLITNLKSVSLSVAEGRLNAQATEPLVIDNNALGYRLYYDLTYFDSFRQATHYAGTTRFEVLTPDNAEQAERWARNRQKAYQGSIRHLVASLIAGTHEREGFLVYKALFDVPADPSVPVAQLASERPVTLARADSLFTPAPSPTERQLFSAKPLEVFYTRQRVISSPYKEMPYAYSLVYMPRGKAATVTTDGWIVQPNGLEVRGVMSDDRLATLLPADWLPAGPTDNRLTKPADEGTVLPADTLLNALVSQWTERQKNPAPVVFLHTDKGFYTTGDQLWFSGYVLDPGTHQPTPSPENGGDALHIDLVAPGGRLIQHQWARVKEGRTSGSFRLSDSLATGVYCLRAYANADAGNARPAFERTVLVISGVSVAVADKPMAPVMANDSVDVQFLPEGGHWVAGLPSWLGIRAIDRQGRGIAVTGRIVSALGVEVGQFGTNRFGTGTLGLVPDLNQAYSAEVRTATGLIKIPLPPADPTGWVLTTDRVSDSTQLTIGIRASAPLAGQPVYLTVQSRGAVVQQAKLNLLNGNARLSIPVAKLPVGIAQVTLFDAGGLPRAERLVFIPERSLPIQAGIATDKTVYQPRESVTVSLRVVDGFGEPLSIVGSAAVTDLFQVPADTSAADIRTHLLLTGELRGRIEYANYYLSSDQTPVRRALDELLMTQGWRRVSRGVGADKPGTIPPLANGLLLTGRVLDKKDRVVPDANVLLTFVDRTGVSFARSARTDQRGYFRLDDLLLTDTVSVQTRIMTITFKPMANARVVFDPPGGVFAMDSVWQAPDLAGLTPFLSAMQRRQADDPARYRDRNARQLQEVVVRAAKPDDDRAARRVSTHLDADAVVRFDDKSRPYNDVYDMLAGRVAGVQVTGTSVVIRGVSSFSRENMVPLFILDGQYITDLLSINPNEIERIEVIKNGGAAAYGARGGAGVVAFFSKRRKLTDSKIIGQTEPILTLYGYPTEREFYVPKYGSPSDSVTNQPDRRDVLYWRPLLATDGQGRATFRFPLSDTARTVRLTVQGITTYGRPVSISRLIKVR